MSKCVELNKKLLELAEFHGEELEIGRASCRERV